MACFGFVTFFFDFAPLLSFPLLNSCIAFSTSFWAFGPYFAMVNSPVERSLMIEAGRAPSWSSCKQNAREQGMTSSARGNATVISVPAAARSWRPRSSGPRRFRSRRDSRHRLSRRCTSRAWYIDSRLGRASIGSCADGSVRGLLRPFLRKFGLARFGDGCETTEDDEVGKGPCAGLEFSGSTAEEPAVAHRESISLELVDGEDSRERLLVGPDQVDPVQ